jgi:hypothetical protein
MRDELSERDAKAFPNQDQPRERMHEDIGPIARVDTTSPKGSARINDLSLRSGAFQTVPNWGGVLDPSPLGRIALRTQELYARADKCCS